MITSQNSTDNQLCALVVQAEQLLEQLPANRNMRRLAAAVRLLTDADSQPLKLAIVGAGPVDCDKLGDQIRKTCPTIEIRSTCLTEIQRSPRWLQETTQWSDAALLSLSGDSDANTSSSLAQTLVHCFRNSIMIDQSAAEHALLAGNRFDCTGRCLKRLANAQRLSSCAHSLKQLQGQGSEYYKLTLSQMERPLRVATSRQPTIDSDKAWLPIRDAFSERTIVIERELSIASERATQPLGELSGLLRSIVNGVSEDDLESSRTSSQLKFSVNAGHLATLNRRFEHTLHERFLRDLKQAEQLVRTAMDESYRQYSPEQRLNDSKLPAIDIQRAWRSVENLMAIGKEAAIELPRKGVFDLLTAGRQKVFIIIMFISLMGRMGLPKLFTTPVAHLGFGLFMAAVMIISMVSAIGRWRKENAQTIDKEIQKFRESLLAEGSKVIDQVERVKLNTIRDYYKEANRSFESICKTQIECALRQQQARAEDLQQRQEAARKVLESRLKQVTEMERTIQRYVESVDAYVEKCRRESSSSSSVAEGTERTSHVKTQQTDSTAAISSTKPESPRAVGALAERRARRLQTQSSTVS